MNRILVKLPPQADLPPGDTFRCKICGTRIRSGQPHAARFPRPHHTLEAVIVEAVAYRVGDFVLDGEDL